jgi:hypothetical protein
MAMAGVVYYVGGNECGAFRCRGSESSEVKVGCFGLWALVMMSWKY